MFAIIRTGGKQYKVAPGTTVKIEKLPENEGEEVVFDDVLLVSDGDNVQVGAPTVAGATVHGKVVEQGKRKKQVVFKMKPKKRYRVKKGHRQPYTEVEVEKIEIKKK